MEGSDDNGNTGEVQHDEAELLTIQMRAVGLATRDGYGVACAHPWMPEGKIYWFRDRTEFLEARNRAHRQQQDGSLQWTVFHAAKSHESFASADLAMSRLVNRSARRRDR